MRKINTKDIAEETWSSPKGTPPMRKTMPLAVGGDHAGFELKGPIIGFLRALGHTVEDCDKQG